MKGVRDGIKRKGFQREKREKKKKESVSRGTVWSV